MSRLIVTADDFGVHHSVNDAVEQAHRAGSLNAASLMVSGRAARDAILRAHRLPGLRVGLHVVLADGWATLDPQLIPAIADSGGRMSGEMFLKAVRMFATPSARRQLESEIRAQFAAFAQTGLKLDHVNAHKHFHIHPTIFDVLLRVGRDYGSPAIRVPNEPYWFATQVGGIRAGAANRLILPWVAYMKHRLRVARVFHNDHLFGIAGSGGMGETRLLDVLQRLPPGVSEVYLHPATDSGGAIAASMSEYRHAEEFAALMSPRIRAALDAVAIRGGYQDVRAGSERDATPGADQPATSAQR
jgi:hopanoid biosynthesis associated protein HpnK